MFREILPRKIWSNDFVEALAEASQRARKWFPESYASRITKAEGIVLDGRVHIFSNRDAIVESSKSTRNTVTTYSITRGQCNCPDAQYHSTKWCKHNISRALLIRALSILKESHNGSGN